MPRGKPNVVKISRGSLFAESTTLKKLLKNNIVQMVCGQGTCIVGRFNVNKETLYKILEKHLTK